MLHTQTHICMVIYSQYCTDVRNVLPLCTGTRIQFQKLTLERDLAAFIHYTCISILRPSCSTENFQLCGKTEKFEPNEQTAPNTKLMYACHVLEK